MSERKEATVTWVPTRAAAVDRLDGLTDLIRGYAARRNHAGPTTSRLSPYIRRRMMLEEEVLARARVAGSFDQVEKFVQEVLWRTYWKGWLEARPRVWATYLHRLRVLDDTLAGAERDRLADAVAGRTDLPYFNAWVGELVETGFLHNHVRMWFASVWVFTLKLPWELGAKFFLDHLLDGDPASNTLSWRWVAGLQTPGKHYLARADNIARYSGGLWVPRPGELNESARPVPDDGLARTPVARPTPGPDARDVRPRAVLLHDEDCGPLPGDWAGAPLVRLAARGGPWHAPSPLVEAFISGACDDADSRAGAVTLAGGAGEVAEWCRANGASELWALRPLTGFTAAALADLSGPLAEAGVKLRYADRGHDLVYFPRATRGFFPFWEAVAGSLRRGWSSRDDSAQPTARLR
jgi:deoxyribodipyrimidine photo-lyase